MKENSKNRDAGFHDEIEELKKQIAEEEASEEADAAAAETDTPARPAEDAPEKEKKESAEQRAYEALQSLASDDDDESALRSDLSLASVLGGAFLAGGWFRKQFWYIVMVVGMLIVYVSNRYACQQEMIVGKMLSDTLLDRRYKALTRSSQLKERTRRSFIEENLADTTLQTAKTPSFNLKVEDE